MKSENKLTRLTMNDLDWATDLLTEAFLNKPPVTQLFLEPYRRKHATYFMKCTFVYTMLYGEGYSTSNKEGVALWLVPHRTALTPIRMYKAGMFSAPFKLGFSAFTRFLDFANYTDYLHKEAAPMPHYYLFAFGVTPSAQGKGVGGFLLESMLERIDREHMPVYLETQRQNNISLYQKFGFEVAAQGAFPKVKGLHNWGLFRKAVIKI